MFNIEDFVESGILYHKIVKKNGKNYPVWVCRNTADEKTKYLLKQMNKEYKKCYKIPLIGFEKD